MANFNKVILMGNLTRDIELRHTQGGMAIAKFGMAVNRRTSSKDGEQRESTCFVDLTAFGKSAELLNQYVRYVADTVLIQTGFPPAYRAANPFNFMDMLALNEVAKSNFFEYRPTQYQNLGASGALEFAIDDSPIPGE